MWDDGRPAGERAVHWKLFHSQHGKDDGRTSERTPFRRPGRVFHGVFSRSRPAPPMQWKAVVQGVITSKDVLLHSVTILRLFGPAFYVRCLRVIASGRPCTFLQVLAENR